MSPSLHHFGYAAEGQIPREAMVSSSSLSVMNRFIKNATAPLILAVAGLIGHGVGDAGHVDLTQIALTAKAANVEIVEPPAFMQKDGSKEYTTGYVYPSLLNEDIGSTRMSSPEPPKP